MTKSSVHAAATIREALAGEPAMMQLRERVTRGGTVRVTHAGGSSASFVAGEVMREVLPQGRSVLVVCAHLDESEQIAAEFESMGFDPHVLAAMEIMPGETSVRLDLVAERLVLLQELRTQPGPHVVVAAIPALMQALPEAGVLDGLVRTIRAGDRLEPGAFAAWLTAAGYQRTQSVETPGEFAVRGGIIDVFPPGGEAFRIDLFGDEVESLFAIDVASLGSDRRLERVDVIGGMAPDQVAKLGTMVLCEHLVAGCVSVLVELPEIVEQGRAYYDRVLHASGIVGPPVVFAAVERVSSAVVQVGAYSTAGSAGDAIELPIEPLPAFPEETPQACRMLCEAAAEGTDVRVLVRNDGEAQRAGELMQAGGGGVRVEVFTLDRGFIWIRSGLPPLMLVPYHELLHRWHATRRKRRITGERAIDTFSSLDAGDYVVHREHGIARFLGLREIDGSGEEYLVLEFSKGAKINVPAARIDSVQRYVGASGGKPELSVIGGRRWKAQKERAAEAVADLAADMLRVQAVRASMPGIRFPPDTPWQREFEAEFAWEETEDQLSAIAAVKRDMERARPMDRLICGDVGFGKTEVAIRAAFKAAESGRQVAVLVPTTVLAEQHERTFRARFADYPFRVAGLSRFRKREDVRRILEETAAGRVDVVVGTHRLLGADVVFRDLGLVVIDEEQRFGVEHKQKLLSLRATADILTLTATPIPRTLHMAMLGLRDISSLTTPPADRRAIVTDVIPYNAQRMRSILERELAREGQTFYVHNRVHDIQSVAAEVQALVPEARVLVGHGQMKDGELERVMLAFVRGEADILVSTTIIESGLDIPRANTMIIRDADMFGLAELHQLRGRVGRFRNRAYCYLILPQKRQVSDVARRRLEALESFSMLGSGFRIALRDLELRGAGNLLGAEQSGHISAVGYEMYCRLLEEAVEGLRSGTHVRPLDTHVDLGFGGLIPKGYLPIDGRRMDAYRRLSQAADAESLERLRKDLVDAYGPLPKRTDVLFDLAEIRIHAAHAGIRRIVVDDRDLVFVTAQPAELEARLKGVRGSVRVVGDRDPQGCVSVYHRPPPRYMEPDSLRTYLRRRLAAGETAAVDGSS